MHSEDYVTHLEADGGALAEAAERAGWDAAVPATSWTVRDLVTHVGGVHRWATAVVRTCSRDGGVPEGRAVGQGPPDDELLGWYRDGHRALVETLRNAPEDLDCFAFLPAPSPLAFWRRRQAHETAMHRADVECAAGEVTQFDIAFAQDGIAELLLGFAARRGNAIAQPGVIALHASDGQCWRVTLGGERTVCEPDDDAAGDAVVRGTSSQIYRWLWNRPAAVTVEGETAVAELWRNVRVRWG
jgi:uncharacterized protein (TIGR03083 family)